MLPEYENLNGHDRFKELSALANAGELTASEWSTLREHLRVCEECRNIHNEYLILDRDGMPMLAAGYSRPNRQSDWDDSATRARLFSRVRELEESDPSLSAIKQPMMPSRNLWAAAAACVVVAIAFGAYLLGSQNANSTAIQTLAAQKRAFSAQLKSQAVQLSQLEAEAPMREQQLAKLRSELRIKDARLNQLIAVKKTTEAELRAALQERESLRSRVETAGQIYQTASSELASLRAERNGSVLKTASLESRVEDLSAANRDQERRLRDAEQYLSSDRDIRELMGARKLYIADVYDVDSRSQTRKPYGRVFYTQAKSLIFYAFDLDQEPGVKKASAKAFQVWGKKGSDEGQPLNLGILYEDNEANRRWVLHFDDPTQLAEINAVFVTVEPNGGSAKPTTKPFLYALLRKEANHP
jgi:anti-sigma-K factor RskA